MSLKVIASHLAEITYISTVLDKKYQASILVKIIETIFRILSPECRGLKIEKKGFDRIAAHLNLLWHSCKECTLSSMASGSK